MSSRPSPLQVEVSASRTASRARDVSRRAGSRRTMVPPGARNASVQARTRRARSATCSGTGRSDEELVEQMGGDDQVDPTRHAAVARPQDPLESTLVRRPRDRRQLSRGCRRNGSVGRRWPLPCRRPDRSPVGAGEHRRTPRPGFSRAPPPCAGRCRATYSPSARRRPGSRARSGRGRRRGHGARASRAAAASSPRYPLPKMSLTLTTSRTPISRTTPAV